MKVKEDARMEGVLPPKSLTTCVFKDVTLACGQLRRTYNLNINPLIASL